MSSMASVSSLMAAARAPTPTGPPSNLSMMVRRSLRSTSSKPWSSTSSSAHASRATAAVMSPSARTCAKSRTRRSRRFAMRGVPRLRRAISAAPSGSIGTPRIREDRFTMNSRSGCE